MRWVVAQPGPDFSVADVCAGWVEALRGLGEEVHVFNLSDRLAVNAHALLDVGEPGPNGELKLRRAFTGPQAKEVSVDGLASMLWKVRPQILLVVSGFFIPAEMLDQARFYGTRVIVAHTEQPYELDRELKLAEHADLSLVNDPTHIEAFRAVAPAVYVPQAYRPGFHAPGRADPQLAADLAFVGTGFPSRRWFFETLAPLVAGRDVLLAGGWPDCPDDSPIKAWIAHPGGECLDNAQAARIYRSAKVGINLYRREGEHGELDVAGWAMGPREVEMAATGLFFLRDPRPEGDRVLHMLPRFAGPGEAAELLAWWLAHDDARDKAAAAAREAVAERTFTNHAGALLRMLQPKE